MSTLTTTFKSKVFDEQVMEKKLSPEIYKSLKKTIEEGVSLDVTMIDAIASAMKEWAIEQGATHYAHWFQPLSGGSAEKHDGFLAYSKNSKLLMKFSGEELVKGEPDASSFASGGLRCTCKARGYTSWDPTSYAFIKGKTLCIPTVFCSYGGEALDKKTPLLRSTEVLNHQAIRILRLLGDHQVRYIKTSVGCEQEYFLITKQMYDARPDIKLTGRTLFGAKSSKGQELEDHYFGVIQPKVAEFMDDVNHELWKLGILAKTEHNEVAPAQYELAPFYTTTNLACDQNLLTMEIMRKVAYRHDLACLFHEKPFAYVNGSGKHNNWSMTTDTGINLLSPGENPYENTTFLLFLCAVIKAVDDYQDLLRIAVASAGNDHRLGANEAPPAIVSIFLGDELSAILKAIEQDIPYVAPNKLTIDLGVKALIKFSKDTSDRNRTSPFAFTGNKFEFRMLGSSDHVASANIMLNAAVAQSLKCFADELEGVKDIKAAVRTLIQNTIKKHKRIIFDGNGYDESWLKEATKQRGLLNYRSAVDCIPHLLDSKNVEMFEGLHIFSKSELNARKVILLDTYCKTIVIEANVMLDMVRKDYLPAIEKYASFLGKQVSFKKDLNHGVSYEYEIATLKQLSNLCDQIYVSANELDAMLPMLKKMDDIEEQAFLIRDEMLEKMANMRKLVDAAEIITAKEYWPFPSYNDILFD